MYTMDPEVIGQGTYGCVHRPPMKCKREQDYTNTVSKLMDSKNANKELSEFALIDKADQDNAIYLGKPTKCNVSNTLQNQNAITKCSSSFSVNKINSYSLLLMKYGGLDLAQFGKTVYKWEKTSNNVRAIELFWIEVVRLFYGIKIFHDNGFIHHDLKHQNIVYNQEENRINFIDFGFMTQKKKVINAAKNSKYWLSDNHHWSFPLENVFWNKNAYMKYTNNATARADASKLAKSIGTNCYAFFQTIVPVNYPKSDLNKLIIMTGTRTIDLMNDFHRSKYNEFLEKSVDTIDSYGLGMGLTYVLQRSKHLLPSELYENLYNLIMEMTNPNLFARLTPDQLLAKYEDILENSGLLQKHNKHIENHLAVDGKPSSSSKAPPITEISGKEFLVIPKDIPKLNVEITRQCPDGKEFNPLTKRCIKTCKHGYSRTAEFKCAKNKTRKASVKICPPGKQRNPITNRCVKDCKSGYLRDKMFKCKRTGNPFE
jgi:serine/threonine protein kinase